MSTFRSQIRKSRNKDLEQPSNYLFNLILFMHEQGLLELEIAACDMNFCISRAASSPGIFKDQQQLLISWLMQNTASGVSPAPPVSLKKAKRGGIGQFTLVTCSSPVLKNQCLCWCTLLAQSRLQKETVRLAEKDLLVTVAKTRKKKNLKTQPAAHYNFFSCDTL